MTFPKHLFSLEMGNFFPSPFTQSLTCISEGLEGQIDVLKYKYNVLNNINNVNYMSVEGKIRPNSE